MKRVILAVVMLAVVATGGCSTIADLRYPLPKPDGEMRQLNKGLWQWDGESRVK